MPSQELVDSVASLVADGNSKEDIREYLVEGGWQEEAVDEVLKEVKKPPSFWEQLPTYPWFAEMDRKTAQLPPKVIWHICAILVTLVIAVGALLYLFANPFALKGDSRDQIRDSHFTQLQQALKYYNNQYSRYPGDLSELVPTYIKYVPVDPKTNTAYRYAVTEAGSNYTLCIYFESKTASEGCLGSERDELE